MELYVCPGAVSGSPNSEVLLTYLQDATWVERWRGYGELNLVMHIPNTYTGPQSLKIDDIIRHPDTDHAMIVESVTIKRGKGFQIRTVKGRSLDSIFERRSVYQANYGPGTPTAIVFEMVKRGFSNYAGNPIARVIGRITTPDPGIDSGAFWYQSDDTRNIGQEVLTLMDAHNRSTKISLLISDSSYEWRVVVSRLPTNVRGVLRSGEPPLMDDVYSVNSKGYVNLVNVYTKDKLKSSTYNEVYGRTPRGLSRRESTIVRSELAATNTWTDTNVNNATAVFGLAELRENPLAKTVVLEIPNRVNRNTYYLGDRYRYISTEGDEVLVFASEVTRSFSTRAGIRSMTGFSEVKE